MPQPAGLLGDHFRELGDTLPAAGGELGEAVVLDVALRVQPQRLLDLDLDPEALAVEAVLVAELVAAKRLVALEDVLERPAPGVVDTHRVVRGDRPVDEAEPRTAPVLLAQPVENALRIPALEHGQLECRVVRDRGKRREPACHAFDSRAARRAVRAPPEGNIPAGTLVTIVIPVITQDRKERLNVQRSDHADLRGRGSAERDAGDRRLLGRVVRAVPRRLPVLDKIAEERAGELKLVKINVDEEQELMIRYGVAVDPDDRPLQGTVFRRPR